MSIRFLGLILIVLILVASLSGCADSSRPNHPRSTTFNDESQKPPPESRPENDPVDPPPAPAEETAAAEAPPKRGTLPPGVNPVAEAEERMKKEAVQAAPMLVNREVRNSMPAYKVPERLRERLQEAHPDLLAPHSTKFEVFNQHLHIRAKDSSMTFTGVLRIPGKQDETIELRCQFDQAAEPWSCDQMYPVDSRVAAERRLQATVNCLDTHRCQRVGVELFVVIDGKTESQHFQNQKFSARKATSGDVDENDDGVKALEKPVPLPNGPARPGPKVLEKPTPENPQPRETVQQQPAPVPEALPEPEILAPELTEKELDDVMEDPNSALEISAPIPMPRPAQGQYSIPGIEKLRPEMGNGVKTQAIGFHNGGTLRSGTALNDRGPGFICRGRSNRNFGTDMTIQLLKGASAAVDKKFPNKSPFVIANISKKGGGRLCGATSCHASHQTGLDVDIVFPSTRNVSDMWSLCGKRGCRAGGPIADQFDEERFWQFVKTLTCAEKKPVIAMFIDTQIKKHMCRWARNKGEDVNNSSSCAFKALQAMKHEPGHHNHVHVRFKCPGNRDCRDATVSLGRGTGC